MKIRSLFWAAAISAVLALVPLSHLAASEITLRLASWGPSSHFVPKSRDEWIEEVNKQGAGMIKIVDYPGGQLYGPSDIHRATARGSVDMGVGLQPAMMGMIPMLQGVYLPFAFADLDAAAAAYSGESREILEAALEERGLKLIYVGFLDGVQLFSRRKNIQSIEDFNGQRVLSASPMMTEIFNRLGASPDTSVPQDEQYMALRLGVADATANSVVGGFFQNTYEVAPYMTHMNMSFATSLMMMNLRKWNQLPEEAQQIMLQAGERTSAYTLEAAKGWEANFLNELSKAGATVTHLPDEERAKIKEMSREVWQAWADRHGEKAQRLLEINLGR